MSRRVWRVCGSTADWGAQDGSDELFHRATLSQRQQRRHSSIRGKESPPPLSQKKTVVPLCVVYVLKFQINSIFIVYPLSFAHHFFSLGCSISLLLCPGRRCISRRQAQTSSPTSRVHRFQLPSGAPYSRSGGACTFVPGCGGAGSGGKHGGKHGVSTG